MVCITTFTVKKKCDKIALFQKLEENKKTYFALLQTLPEGIILVNKYTKKQVYTNKYMMRLLKIII